MSNQFDRERFPQPTSTSRQESDKTSGEVEFCRCSSRSGLKVLLVDDLFATQKVTRSILEASGHAVQRVDNGREAVDFIVQHNEKIDLILMDIQMPEMDGLEATRAIRSLPDVCSKTPIVALTSNTLPGDREACLAAGMDAYLPKPVDANRLLAVVEAIAATTGDDPSTCSGNTAMTHKIPASDATKATGAEKQSGDNLEQLIEYGAALRRVGGNRHILVELAGIVLDDSPLLIDRLKIALNLSDKPGLVASAHALKGLLANFGAASCVKLLVQFEADAKQNDFDSISNDFPRFLELHQRLSADLVELAKTQD